MMLIKQQATIVSLNNATSSSSGSKQQFDPFKPLVNDQIVVNDVNIMNQIKTKNKNNNQNNNSKILKTKESIRLRYSFSSYLNATIVEMPFTIGGGDINGSGWTGSGIISLVILIPNHTNTNESAINNNNPSLSSSTGSAATETLLSRLNAQLIVDLVQNLEVRRIDITVSLMI